MREEITIETETLTQYIVFNAHEYGEWNVSGSEGVSTDDLCDGVRAANVDEIERCGDGQFLVRGEFEVRAVVDRKPASGGGRLEPPTNPPEVITEGREAMFCIDFAMEDNIRPEVRVESY